MTGLPRAGSDDEFEVLAEVSPGYAQDHFAMIEAAGGWVCEIHPDQPHPHDGCDWGVGMLPNQSGERG